MKKCNKTVEKESSVSSGRMLANCGDCCRPVFTAAGCDDKMDKFDDNKPKRMKKHFHGNLSRLTTERAKIDVI